MSGRAVEASGDVNVLLLDKTGTITLGNRQATEFIARAGRRGAASSPRSRSSRRWRTRRPKGARSSILAKEQFGMRGRELHELGAHFVPFTAQTRMSASISPDGRAIRKGAADAVDDFVRANGGDVPRRGAARTWPRSPAKAARRSWSPTNARVLGVDLSEGHRQGRHARALRPAAHDGHPHGDDHRRQPAHRATRSRAKRASTTSWPRRRRRTSSR